MSIKSWIKYDENDFFPIQNLPYAVLYDKETNETNCYSRISTTSINLSSLEKSGLLDNETFKFDGSTFNSLTLNKFISLGKTVWKQVRHRLTSIFTDETYSNHDQVLKSLKEVSLLKACLPVQINDYTDFYSSKNHAYNIGSLLRPTNPLQPNWNQLPVGYHGRSSTIVIDGTDVRRPSGQVKKSKDEEISVFSQCKRLDYEVEMGVIIGKTNEIGVPIKINEASEYVFGFVLVNDWSARDIQAWEYVPLGPFTAKNFMTTVSAWIVVKEALEEFTVKLEEQDPRPLKYLYEENLVSYDIPIDIYLKSEKQKEYSRIGTTNYKYMYWTVNQQITHHTVTGCKMQVGDLIASGTISGKEEGTYGCLMEANKNSTRKIIVNDEERVWLNDGDSVLFKAYCQGKGYRIGFSECSGKVIPALGDEFYN